MESFARALRELPGIIASNAGFDSADIVAQLRVAHHEGNPRTGLDMENSTIGDMKELKVLEAMKSKLSMLLYAHEAAEMVLRVDEIIRCAPRFLLLL